MKMKKITVRLMTTVAPLILDNFLKNYTEILKEVYDDIDIENLDASEGTKLMKDFFLNSKIMEWIGDNIQMLGQYTASWKS